jgi:hypothetical protein
LDDLGYCVDLSGSHENSSEKLPLGSEIRWWLSITQHPIPFLMITH